MKITFSIPRTIDGTPYEPDESADLPDDLAKTLLRDGHARRAETEPAADNSDQTPQPPPKTGKGSGTQAWVDYASAHGVAVPEDATREDIITALNTVGIATEPPAQPPIEPDQGDNEKE